LVANSLFFAPNYTLFAPKNPLFNGYFALFSHVLMVVKGLFIPIVVDFYAFRLAFSSILHCI
jgi:hypothetical protein